MRSDLAGSNIRPFFSRSLEYETLLSSRPKVKRTTNSTCNCSPSASVGAAITIDATNSSHPQILYVDGQHGHIWATDVEGCTCYLLLNATENNESGELGLLILNLVYSVLIFYINHFQRNHISDIYLKFRSKFYHK